MSPEKTIIFANTAEAFKDQLLESGNTDEGQARIRHELALSQRAFFWEKDHKVVVTPYGIPEALINHNSQVLGFQDVINVSPRELSLDLSAQVQGDIKLWTELVQLLRDNPGSKLSPYAYTPGFIQIINRLRGENVNFQVSEEPTDPNIASFLDSKAGFRQIMIELSVLHPEVKIPAGQICSTRSEAIDFVQSLFAQGKAGVIKANMGESGWGTIFLKPEDFSDVAELNSHIDRVLDGDNIWRGGLLIAEEYIHPDLSVSGGSPSTELYVDNQGHRITYSCEQVVSPSGEFLGVGVGAGSVKPEFLTTLETAANIVGQRYYDLGYRGFFDMDFVISTDGTPYAVETNTRRTGGTNVYDIARAVFGEQQSLWGYLLSQDSLRYGDQAVNAEELLARSQKLLYPMNGSKRGVIITLINTSDPVLGYVAIGDDKAEVLRLQKQIKRSLLGK